MFMQQAVKLCPQLEVLHYDFEQYRVVSEDVYRILFALTAVGATVQPVSVDEAYVELPRGLDGYQVGERLRRDIQMKTGCSASVGVGSNMLMARLATKKAKPDGIFVLTTDMLPAHLSSLSLADLPGVGRKHARLLREKGCVDCRDVWTTPQPVLCSWLGDALGKLVFNFSRGIDNRTLKAVADRKSVGVDINYGIRFSCSENAEEFLRKLCDELSSRLKQVCLSYKRNHAWVVAVTFCLQIRLIFTLVIM